MVTTLCRTIHSKPVHTCNTRLFHQESSVSVKETFFKRRSRKSYSPGAGERKTIDPPTAEPGHTQSVGDGVGLRETKASKTSLESTRTKKDNERPKSPQTGGAGSGRSSPHKLEIRDAISGEPLPAPQRMYTGTTVHDFRMRLSGCDVGGGSVASLCDAKKPDLRPTTTPSYYWPFSAVDTRRGRTNMAAQAPWRRQVFGNGRLAKMAAFMRDAIHRPSKEAASASEEDVAASKKRGVWWEIYREPETMVRDSFPARISPRLPQPPSRNKMAGKLGDGDDGARSPFVWQRLT